MRTGTHLKIYRQGHDNGSLKRNRRHHQAGGRRWAAFPKEEIRLPLAEMIQTRMEKGLRHHLRPLHLSHQPPRDHPSRQPTKMHYSRNVRCPRRHGAKCPLDDHPCLGRTVLTVRVAFLFSQRLRCISRQRLPGYVGQKKKKKNSLARNKCG